MASRRDMDYTYTFLDKIFRFSIGENGDFSGAKYDGDFTLSLEEAQRRKHEFIADRLSIGRGSRVLDMGCGWGPFLRFLQSRGAVGVGVTLSEGQVNACRRNGLDVHLMDCREVTEETFGPFDSVVSLGAFEHFCSIEEWREGKQDAIYRRLFEHVARLLAPGRRFYLQTMVFGKNMIPYEEIDLDAPVGSDAYYVGALAAQFPGSWLPYGSEHVERCASPHFALVEKSSGRLDYIETITQWERRYMRFTLKKYLYYATLVPSFLTDSGFRKHIEILKIPSNRMCFEREILDHFRFVFERK
jgi:cyclopropane-fatty-acyl-phospholipid synthase